MRQHRLNPRTRELKGLCIKLGRGQWDACVGTWDLKTRGEGCGDINGTRGRMGCRDVWDGVAGMSSIGEAGGKVGDKCGISCFMKMCYLWSTLDSIVQNHIGDLMMYTQNISLYRSNRTDYLD